VTYGVGWVICSILVKCPTCNTIIYIYIYVCTYTTFKQSMNNWNDLGNAHYMYSFQCPFANRTRRVLQLQYLVLVRYFNKSLYCVCTELDKTIKNIMYSDITVQHEFNVCRSTLGKLNQIIDRSLPSLVYIYDLCYFMCRSRCFTAVLTTGGEVKIAFKKRQLLSYTDLQNCLLR